MNQKLNADRFTGREYVSLYHQFRPSPPAEILLQGLNYLGKTKAQLIVDLGCGTGISTEILSEYSDDVIGVEPSGEMVALARDYSSQKNISYQQNFANEINIESSSVDIVTCSQSFHWMEPKSTLKEIDRILTVDGVLLIYDVIWPPGTNYECEIAYRELFQNVDRLTHELDERIAQFWDKKRHLQNVAQSNYFDYVKESYYHKTELFDKEKFVGIALSQGGLEALLKRGYSEEEIGITKFKEIVEAMDHSQDESLTYNYRVVFGVRRGR